MLTIIFLAPGGHRQWPMSISALLERRVLAGVSNSTVGFGQSPSSQRRRITSGSQDVASGPKVVVVPPTPIKFLDIGTKMGCYRHWGSHSRERRHRQYLSSSVCG